MRPGRGIVDSTVDVEGSRQRVEARGQGGGISAQPVAGHDDLCRCRVDRPDVAVLGMGIVGEPRYTTKEQVASDGRCIACSPHADLLVGGPVVRVHVVGEHAGDGVQELRRVELAGEARRSRGRIAQDRRHVVRAVRSAMPRRSNRRHDAQGRCGRLLGVRLLAGRARAGHRRRLGAHGRGRWTLGGWLLARRGWSGWPSPSSSRQPKRRAT